MSEVRSHLLIIGVEFVVITKLSSHMLGSREVKVAELLFRQF